MARPSLLSTLFSTLIFWRPVAPGRPAPAPRPEPLAPQILRSPTGTNAEIAWGAKVVDAFKKKVIEIAGRLQMEPDHLMAIMAFETGRSFDPTIVNRAGSGATGLIQFMPATARGLGTTTAALAQMNAIDQLDYVEAYLAPYRGRIGDIQSAYMAVLYPRAIGKPSSHVLFRKGSRAYKLNRGLDRNGDGQITKQEAAARVVALLEEGMRPGNIG
ncbi:MAG: transglycosylase SLT domain-containing protein [Hoeflea sp.]|uniref:transglycosylase SLT domain-containing protein n=1 Tax=Hoeflea sp. TaxID=1940281 RepID=UPI0032EE5DC4